MPYTAPSDAPKWVQDIGETSAKQWVSVWNSVYAESKDEAKAFAAAASAVKRSQGGKMAELDMDKQAFNRYVKIEKYDDEQRMVYGYASTPELDSQGDRVSVQAMEGALPDYMRFGNIREMHERKAVGKAKSASIDETGFYLGAKVVDDAAWEKVKEGVLSGFSIGGRVTGRDEKDASVITGLELVEVSLVDRPANPGAVFDVWKVDSGKAVKVENGTEGSVVEKKESQEETLARLSQEKWERDSKVIEFSITIE